MSIHIKQLKGANDLIERDEFVKNNLIGKMKFKDGNLMLSVPLKIEKTVEGVASDFSLLDENDFITKEYVDTNISALKGDVSANYDTLREIEDNIKSISATAGVDPISAESKSSKGIEIGSISIGDNTVTFYIDLSNYVEKSGENAAFTTVPTAPSISSAYDDNKLVTASFVHEVERKLIGAIDDDTIEVLTTLSDISAAINNDPEYYSTVQEALNAKLNKSDISIIPESSTGTPIGKIILDEDTYEFKVDLSALDFFNSPNFTGEPTVPDVAQGDSSSLVANTRFVTTAVSNAISSVKGEPPDNLNTLQKISTAIGNDSAFAANVNSSLSTIDSTVSDLNISISSAVESIESVNNNKQPLSNALTSISSLPTEADRMIYTTAKDIYAVTTLTGSARTLISKTDEQGMRDYLSVPKADGTGASGSWSITADKALKDKDGNPIDTTYLKTADAVNVSVSNLVTGTDVTRLGTITIGDKSHDINVDLSSYAPLSNATLTGAPAAPSPTLTDSSTRIATTGFVQSVVSGAIDDLVGEGTPEALNTLKEIADIIGSDADFTGSIITELSNKVSKEDGKGLSTNDFTTEEKNKLSGIEAGANNYSLPAATTTTKGGVIVGTGLSVKDGKVSLETATNSAIGGIKLGNGVTTTTGGVVSVQSATTDQNGLMTKEQVSKLNSIAAGAEVNVINRVKVNDTVLPISDKTVTINLTDYVQKDGTKVLSDNNYTTEEKSKLAGIETGAQVNKINAIKVNGTFVEPDSDKAINITVSGGGDYILPNATTINKGGIIVGSGLAVNNATVSVATATTDKIGGIKLGNGVTTTTGGIVSIQSATSGQNGLMTSDQASKLAGITAGAEVNVINAVKVNDTTLSVSDKTVTIDLTNYVQKDGSKILSTNDFTKSYKDKLDSIADSATKDNVSIVAGTVNSTINTAVTSDPYINLTDNNVKKGSVQIKGDGVVSVSSDSSGIITVKSTNTTYSNASTETSGLLPTLSGNTDQYLRGDGSWIKPPNTTYSAGTGISLTGTNNTIISADAGYLGSVAKGTDTTKFLNSKGEWAVPPNTDTNTTYSAGNGLSLSITTFSVKVPTDSGLSVTDKGVSLTAAQTNVIGGVKVAAVNTSNISLGSDGNISVPAASSSQAGVVKLGGGTTNYLRADGSWAAPTGTTYSVATTTSNGLLSSTDKTKLDSVTSSAFTGVSVDDTNVTFTKGNGDTVTIQTANTTYGTVTGVTSGLVPTLTNNSSQYLRADGSWATPPDTNTTYSAGTGISLTGTTFKAHPDYIGDVKKDTTDTGSGKFLKADGTWATPPDTNSTYSAGNGLQLSSGAFSVKVPSNSGLSVTTNGVSVTAATTSAIGGVKVAAVATSNVSLGTDGSISVPLATASQAGAVKIGTNLSVNNGTVSLSGTNVTDALGFTPVDSKDIPATATVMTGASASAAGKAGLVPAPAKGNQDKFLKADGTWATVVSSDTTYTAGTGISLSGTTFSAHSNYLGSIAKETDTAKFLNSKGEWAVPPDTNTTYTASNGLQLSGGAFSVKTPANSGLSVTSNGISVTAATGSAIGGVKIGEGISTGTGGVISIPAATTSNNGLMTTAQVNSLAAVAGATKNNVSLTAGASNGTINAAVTSNPYINVTDNNSNKGSIQLKSEGAVTISSNAAGVITVKSTDTNTTYSAGTGLSLSGTTFSANSNYLGSIAKGTDTTKFLNNKGEWAVPPNTDTNDKVAQKVSTTSKTYPVLLTGTADADNDVAASNVIFGKGVKVNPSTSVITAATFDGMATKASLDSAGNQISTTYLTKTAAASTYPSLTGTNSFSGANTFTGRTYVKDRLVMSTGLAMSSVDTNKWDNATDKYGNSYIPHGGIVWYQATNSATGIFGITSSSIGSNADNLLLTSGGSLILSAGEIPALNLLNAYGTPNSMYTAVGGNGQLHLMSQYDIEFVTNANKKLDPSNNKRFVFGRTGNATIPGILKTSQIFIPARNDSLHYWGSQKGTDSTASNEIDKTPHIHFYQGATASTSIHAFSGLYGIDENNKALWLHGYNHLVLSASSPAIGAVRGAGTKTTGGELYFENLGLLNNIANDNIIADSDGASINADIHLMAPYIYFHANHKISSIEAEKSNANLNTNFINRQGTLHLCNSLLFYARKDSINNSSYSQHSLPSSNTDGIDLYIAHGIIANSIPSANFLSCYNSLSASVEPSGYIAWRLHDSGYTTGIFPVRAYNAAAMNNLLVNAANSLVLASGKNSGLNLIRRYGTDSLFASTFNGNGTTFVMGDTSVELLTNCSQDSITPNRFTFNKTGYAEFPELRLDRPLSVRNGGTGVTVASDLIDVMGLGNGTGNYFCNLSTESLGHSILTNDTTTSPMPGFNALRDGMTVHMFVTQHPTSSVQAHLSFNGTPAHGVYSIDGSNGKAVSVVAKSLQAAHCYKAVYHSTAFGVSTSPAPAYTWLLYPEF